MLETVWCHLMEDGVSIIELLEGVEWEDEATKARFLPSCIQQV